LPAALSLCSWHEAYYGMKANETAAITSLRKINLLESRYAAAHTDKGFACALSGPKATEQSNEAGSPTEALSGDSHGYQFALSGCNLDSGGIVTY
jgi:hypothetical protein